MTQPATDFDAVLSVLHRIASFLRQLLNEINFICWIIVLMTISYKRRQL